MLSCSARATAISVGEVREATIGTPMRAASRSVSSEMLLKAARMGVPIVASRTSPTEMAVALAEQLNITVCGYVRPDSLNLYAGDAVLLGGAAVAARR